MAKQVGRSNARRDRQRRAKRPGWRRSASGRRYFENRRNRSDTGRGDRPGRRRERVDVRPYDREREGRPEHVREYTRTQVVAAEAPPALAPLRRREGTFSRSDEARQEALRDAIKSLSRLQRKVNARNSTQPFVEAVDDLMASLRRGDPNFRLANDLAAHVATLRKGESIQDVISHEVGFAEEYPGYVAHGYVTKVPDAYDILDHVRHEVVFEYGGELPGNVVVLSAQGTAEKPEIGIYAPGITDRPGGG